MAIIMDGKAVAKKVKLEVAENVRKLQNLGIKPVLAVIIVGDDPASRIYVNNKKNACNEVNIKSKEYSLPNTVTQNELINLIKKLNNDKNTHGILVQLPLPSHINQTSVIESIDPSKDVDAFCEINVGKIVLGNNNLLPCTPAGIMEILKSYNISVEGKHCVIIGRSNIVGKPTAMLLLHSNATVTICHSKTKNLKEICRNADILVSSVGKPKFITKDMIKPGAVVIDVGINKDSNNKLCGDVDFSNVQSLASYITPVPGGVGPMTIAMLLKNTVNLTYP